VRCTDSTSITGDVVTVLVGEYERKFIVHEEPLRAHSRFFDAAMSGVWLESSERIIRLPMEGPKLFSVYVQWIYTSRVALPDHWGLNRLAHLYIMASRLQDGNLQDAAIDCMIRLVEEDGTCSPLEDAVGPIYDHTATGDLARKFLVDCWVKFGWTDWVHEADENVDAQFYCDLARALFLFQGKASLPSLLEFDGSTCKYHQHGDNECYSKKYTAREYVPREAKHARTA
jgi:hypothetical protein